MANEQKRTKQYIMKFKYPFFLLLLLSHLQSTNLEIRAYIIMYY